MKTTANAGELANALALAASLSNDKVFKERENLRAVRLTATDDTLTITANVLDHQLALSVPAEIRAAGELAVSGARLAALVAAFPTAAAIEIHDDSSVTRISCGRSRFKLPTLATNLMPSALQIANETGRIELAREEARALFSRTAFAASIEQSRYYLNGICLHDDGNDLAAVATDGYRLCKLIIPGAAGLSSDYRLIVPNPAVEIVAKLLRDTDIERVTLRRSKSLFGLETTKAVFVSKLIDYTFPRYEALLPKPSGNSVNIDRAELVLALERIAAVAEDGRHAIVGLAWNADEPALSLHLARTDAADDSIAAEVAGIGNTKVKIRLLAEQLAELEGKRVVFDCAGGFPNAVLIADAADEDLTALLMPYQPNAVGQAA